MTRLTTLLTAFLLSTIIAVGQDIRGGEISFTNVSSLTYSFDIYLYTQTSMGIPHTNILFDTGDSGWDTLTGTLTTMPNDVTEWYYTTNHTYPGPGVYSVAATDSFRIAGIQNVTGSSTESIYLQAMLIINPFLGVNTSPTLNNNQLQVYSSGGNFYHNPFAIDPDGDSLSFALVPTSTTNYTTPPGAIIDQNTGLFQMPITTGIYAINIQIQEYRSAILIGRTYREMVIDSNALTGITYLTINQNDLKTYPNPTANTLTIENQNGLQTIDLYDIDGRQILHINNLRTDKIEISTAHLSSGVYTLETIDALEHRRMKKIIKK
ncbi:MAG: T9SS type A sorting domain-containing protein [Bacteroidetes bacterium]|nr:T9SS type A sorting domain-containing protein [Bacteroidota bacterium]